MKSRTNLEKKPPHIYYYSISLGVFSCRVSELVAFWREQTVHSLTELFCHFPLFWTWLPP